MTTSRFDPASEDGYRLWLRYCQISRPHRLAEYRHGIQRLLMATDHPILDAAGAELERGLSGLLGERLPRVAEPSGDATVILGTPGTCPWVATLGWGPELDSLGKEGYVIRRASVGGRPSIVVAGAREVSVLYGAFALLRHLQTERPLDQLDRVERPRVDLRMLDHWDNLDRTVERGYAGSSLWDWHKLPDYVAPLYQDYARANASIGINGVVLNNVNANALILTEAYLEKVARLAEVFRPYGIRVYLSARFNAPVELGALTTADPADPAVRRWWRSKVAQIYRNIADFGGLLVKANSEGQPGPGDYGRSHADGANLLAEALEPHGGRVIWRSFVYRSNPLEDRAQQAYREFVPLDGQFAKNVLVQVKNGPIDFQPREPFHPLFGAMPRTPLMLEFQLTQEYLGFATHLAYLGPLFKETLEADTFRAGPGSTVARVVDGSLEHHSVSGMAGVANIGTERNWCGHPFAAANWYAFGRLAWDHTLSAEAVADEWLRMTFSNDLAWVERASSMMLASREAVVRYMTPLGLHHLMAESHHYGPAPWHDQGRPDWTSVYFHRADRQGIGFDRTPSGSGATLLYASPLREQLACLKSCPERLLLWFHHLPWSHRMRSGRTLWEELCHSYQSGVEQVRWMAETWSSLRAKVDSGRFDHVKALLRIQEKEASWWRDACLAYFRTLSGLSLPPGVEPPARTLAEYQAIRHHHVPGI